MTAAIPILLSTLFATPGATTSTTSTAALSVLSAPTIELITMSPGEALYTYWGHAAIRVLDPSSGRDVVYNYGSIDFSGDFFVRMMTGQVDAFVGVSSFARTLEVYSGEDRTVTRRTLALSPERARRLAASLSAQVPEGRSRYRYHHFRDNCSTRVADEIDQAADGALSALGHQAGAGTFRDLALGIVRPHPWLYAAIDVVMTGAVDEPIDEWDARFLPDRLGELVDRATVDGQPLVARARDAYVSKSFDPHAEWSWPWIQIYLMFLVPLCLLCLWSPRAGAAVWGLFSGLLSLGVLLLWLGTTYEFLNGNWSALIFLPTHLGLFAAALSARFSERGRRRGAAAYLGMHALVLIGLAGLGMASVISQSVGPALGFALPPTLILWARLRRSEGQSRPISVRVRHR